MKKFLNKIWEALVKGSLNNPSTTIGGVFFAIGTLWEVVKLYFDGNPDNDPSVALLLSAFGIFITQLTSKDSNVSTEESLGNTIKPQTDV